MYEEAKPILFSQNNDIASNLCIYIILSRTEARNNIHLTLKTIPSSKQFQSIKTSNLETTWSPNFPLDPEDGLLATQNCLDLLHNQLETIRGFVSQVKAVEKVDIIWPELVPYDREHLDPLSRGPRDHAVYVHGL
jgi:hypothetical protein